MTDKCTAVFDGKVCGVGQYAPIHLDFSGRFNPTATFHAFRTENEVLCAFPLFGNGDCCGAPEGDHTDQTRHPFISSEGEDVGGVVGALPTEVASRGEHDVASLVEVIARAIAATARPEYKSDETWPSFAPYARAAISAATLHSLSLAKPEAATSSSVLDLDAIEREAEAATPGPWAWENLSEKGGTAYAVGVYFAIVDKKSDKPLTGCVEIDVYNESTGRFDEVAQWTERIAVFEDDGTGADAAFIASARTNVPALCKELRAARAEIERQQRRAERFKQRAHDLGDEVASLRSGAEAQGDRL